MSLYAFHLGQIISTVLGQVDHDGRHGNADGTPIRGETSETDHTQKRRLFARIGISKISNFKSIYLENHVSHNGLWSSFCLKKWEKLIYYGNREI
jgi:hypothetical protein